jgi:hypothetical protein
VLLFGLIVMAAIALLRMQQRADEAPLQSQWNAIVALYGEGEARDRWTDCAGRHPDLAKNQRQIGTLILNDAC